MVKVVNRARFYRASLDSQQKVSLFLPTLSLSLQKKVLSHLNPDWETKKIEGATPLNIMLPMYSDNLFVMFYIIFITKMANLSI